MNDKYIVGIISDTHGLLRPEAITALRGSDQILHAGDIGDPAILEALAKIAPVTAIRGNVDRGVWAKAIQETAVVEIGEISIYMLHDLKQLDLDPIAAGFAAVISGHSHQPKEESRKGVLYFNPGAAGPRRFNLPITVGRLVIQGKTVSATVIDLQSKDAQSKNR